MATDHSMHSRPYLRLAAMVLLSFIAMYILMYAMVDRFGHVYNSLNQVYMAALMAAPMLVIELVLMGSMYPDRRRNAVLIAIGVAALLFFWLLIRWQVAIDDRQFLRSMIPHHSGAILMCEEANLTDERLRELCRDIIAGQSEEIAEMEALLAGPLE